MQTSPSSLHRDDFGDDRAVVGLDRDRAPIGSCRPSISRLSPTTRATRPCDARPRRVEHGVEQRAHASRELGRVEHLADAVERGVDAGVDAAAADVDDAVAGRHRRVGDELERRARARGRRGRRARRGRRGAGARSTWPVFGREARARARSRRGRGSSGCASSWPTSTSRDLERDRDHLVFDVDARGRFARRRARRPRRRAAARGRSRASSAVRARASAMPSA